MKLGFVIACHNRIDDLMLHLEVFNYCPFPHTIIVVHTMDYDDNYMREIRKYENVRIDGVGHYVGPLLCAVAGVQKAHDLGLDYVVYRNSDDIIYNYQFEQKNFRKMAEDRYLCGGYSWLNVGVSHDITLNQVYFDVPAFAATAADADAYFRRSPRGFLCEFKMARWVKRTLSDFNKQFYRLPDREMEPGIGWERKDIYAAFKSKNMKIPEGFWERLENNNRYFNFDWQLIGSHNIAERLTYWKKIRPHVSYHKEIEKEPHFVRFFDCAKHNKPWNIEIKPGLVTPNPIPGNPKLISKRIF